MQKISALTKRDKTQTYELAQWNRGADPDPLGSIARKAELAGVVLFNSLVFLLPGLPFLSHGGYHCHRDRRHSSYPSCSISI
jgi:hypothetical protein